MATVVKDLGAITAYAYAVAGGYSGTEAEFEALLGNIAEDLSEIENLSVTVTTLPAGSSATASYSNGVLSLGIPKGDKGDTGATPNFSIGTVQTLLPTQDATATITGTAEAPVLNLGIPKGYSGDANNLAADYSPTKTYAVGDYCIYNGSLYRCITPITTAEAWTAAHWTAAVLGDDVGDLKSALETNDKIIYTPSPYDPTLSNYKALIAYNTGKWVTNPYYACGIGNIPNGANKVIVTANNSNITRIAFLTTTAHTSGTTPDYATGWTEIDRISAGESKTYVIPDDALYLYYLKGADNLDYTPGSIEYLSDAITPIQESVDVLTDALTITTAIDPETASNYVAFITASNVWGGTAVRRGGIISIANGTEKIHVKANAEYNSAFAILTTNSHVNGQAPDYATGWTKVDTLSAGAEKTYTVPSDGKYLYYTRMFDGGDRLPQSIEYLKMFSANAEVTVFPLGLHEMPRNESALNIVKRCRQMTDIRWIPAVDLYRYMLVQRGGVIPDTAETQNYFGTFKAGTEYTGIPYGRVSGTMSEYGYDYATAAHYIPLETFVSSVCNPDSKLCKEDVHSLANHRSVLYATVCSGLTCYALDVPEVPTASIGNISGLTLVGKVNDNGVLLADSNFKIGDVLNKYDYHTAIITDIIRDNEGVLQYVELSDASTAGLADSNYADGQIGGLCRRKGWTRAQLYNVGAWGDYNLYRYSGTVTYTPNPYVNVGDEFNMQRIEHFPCMPYEGNKFTYKTGYIPNNAVKILVSPNLDYGYLKVFKDGTEITGSPFTVTSETTSIDVTEISAGTYTAYLCNISDGDVTNLTYACEWTITA